MQKNKKILLIFIALYSIFIFESCDNPFAPRLTDGSHQIIADQTTVDGLFENFRYSYIFKDTLVYGRLLANNFTFTYHNYEKNIDVSWGRDEDMLTTAGLFNAAQSLDLIWNQVVISMGDSTRLNITRGFTLNITFDPTYTEEIVGRVNLTIVRMNPDSVWLIERWIDESNF